VAEKTRNDMREFITALARRQKELEIFSSNDLSNIEPALWKFRQLASEKLKMFYAINTAAQYSDTAKSEILKDYGGNVGIAPLQVARLLP